MTLSEFRASIPYPLKVGVILNPGFSRVKDLARIVTAACVIRHRLHSAGKITLD
jgi:hypothetical protein